MRTVTREEARRIDKLAIEKYGIPGIVLMENAGLAVSRVVSQMFGDKKDARVAIFCGKGNNGGDGFVVARHLINGDIGVNIYLLCEKKDVKGDALINLNILLRMGQEVKELTCPDDIEGIKEEVYGASLIVDAILGTGAEGDVKEPMKSSIDFINGTLLPIVSVDIPSGLDADNGVLLGTSIKATKTVTFVAPKKGFYLNEGRFRTGEVTIADIGISDKILAAIRMPGL